MKQILVTAFEPFGGSSRNTSAEVLRLLPETIGGCAVTKTLLPVVFGTAADTALRQEADAVFLLGEAAGRAAVTPERTAVNLRDARIPDNAGRQPKGEACLPGSSAAYHTEIPAGHIVSMMQKEGYAVEVSGDAGTFVCNDTFYLVGTGRNVPVEFIHCPADPEKAPEYAKTVERFISLSVSCLRTVRAAVDYVRDLFAENSDGHGFSHTMRVYRTSLRIADTEPEADRFIVALGALLHDADDPKLFQTENNLNARTFLEQHGCGGEPADRICSVINSVSFSKNRDRRPETPEGRIVQDADRLDAIGAVGVGRTFAYGGKHGRPPEDSIAHFHEKLLLLKDLMNTPAAKNMAEKRHAFMEAFLREWAEETEE